MKPALIAYFTDGCGRCSLVGTPACNVKRWQAELQALRGLVLDCDLTEERKWGVPCYTFQHKNVLLLHAFKEYCALNFMKGALLDNSAGMLTQQTQHVQAARQIRFRNIQQIAEAEPVLKAYIKEAIEVEKGGGKVRYKPVQEFALPEELHRAFAQLPALELAFHTLTPGRQRGYLLYFSAAKQAKTREARIAACAPHILAGKGRNE